jgi:hypothetical protein
MEPSIFYTQHLGVEAPRLDGGAFRPYWTVRTRIDRLRADGAITEREWRAAVAFRSSLMIALRASWPPRRLDGGTGCGLPGRVLEVRLDALARLRRVRSTLGTFAAGLIEITLIDNESWADLGRRLGVDPKTARHWTVESLRALAMVGRQ